jgi:hypothetical protein
MGKQHERVFPPTEEPTEIVRGSSRRRRVWTGSASGVAQDRAVRAVMREIARAWPSVWGDVERAKWSARVGGDARAFPESLASYWSSEPRAWECEALGPHRRVWSHPPHVPGAHCSVIAVLEEIASDQIELRRVPPFVTAGGDRIERWSAKVNDGSAVDAWRAVLALLEVESPEIWGGLLEFEWKAGRGSFEFLSWYLAGAGLPSADCEHWLRESEVTGARRRRSSSHPDLAIFEMQCDALYPAQLLRFAWVARVNDEQIVVLAGVTHPNPRAGRSPLAFRWEPRCPGRRPALGRIAEEREQAKHHFSCWDPSSTYHHPARVEWLCRDAPGDGLVVPEVTLVEEGDTFGAPARVKAGAGPEYETHRAAVLAAAKAQGRAENQGYFAMTAERLEGRRVPWEIFRDAYDPDEADPPHGPKLTKGSFFTERTFPKARKPKVIYRWNGHWNGNWLGGYGDWLAHVWSIELRVRPEEREIMVVINVQGD